MMSVRHVVVIATTLAVAQGVDADLVPLNDPHLVPYGTTEAVSDCASLPSWQDAIPLVDFCSPHLRDMPVGLPADAEAGAEPADAHVPVYVLADKQDSLALSLYALLFAGLFKAAPYMKVLSAAALPVSWYDGRRLEIAHRLDLSPGDLHSAASWFVPPGCITEDFLSRYRQEAVVASWRDSQFTPIALAPRGPPLRCHSSF
ncbi:MAG: hypothetical protein KBE65_07060 [Phycisphaerae bacterium]|nr:hypothetical protein [Phycisphaerae bacterium]